MNFREFLIGFSYASVLSVLIPIILLLVSNGSSRLRKTVLILLLLSLLFDIGNRLYFYFGYKGYLILNIYTVVEFIVLCYLYSTLLKSTKIIIIYLVIFLVVFSMCTVFYQPINDFQNVPMVLESLAVITFSCIHFVDIYRDLPTENLVSYLPGWVNVSIFYYFAFDFFLFALSEYIFKNASPNVSLLLWAGFHSFNNIIKNLIFATGIYLCNVRD